VARNRRHGGRGCRCARYFRCIDRARYARL
jgi:hypothetical protein